MKDNKISSLLDIIKFNNTKLKGKNIKISEVYGKERFCYLLYSLIRMEQPNTVVELGTGLGTCALLIAQALKENNKGIIWTIDNGADWADYKESFQKIFKTHKDYFNSFLMLFVCVFDNFSIFFFSFSSNFFIIYSFTILIISSLSPSPLLFKSVSFLANDDKHFPIIYI